jgi:hypothetical protein
MYVTLAGSPAALTTVSSNAVLESMCGSMDPLH